MGVPDYTLVIEMITPGGEWDWERLDPLLPTLILLRIAGIKCPLSHFPRDDDARCALCGADVEDVNHILRTCPPAYITWKELIRVEKLGEFLHLDIKDWIKCNLIYPMMFAKDPIGWELMFGGVYWYIWRSLSAAAPYTVQPWSSIAATSCERVPWSPPPCGWMKVNVDAAQGNNSGYMTVGVLIRDNNG
ncbi:hypothetical protein V6N13_128739 [Hibiscus sabdariffa]